MPNCVLIFGQAYEAAFDKLAEKHSDAIEWKTSVLERRGKAMFLKETYAVPTLIAKCGREVAHIHDTDKSGHLLLSFADAKEVISKGWGERHRLTGTGVIPLGYTMLYVPRKTEEIYDLIKIFDAGIEYAKSSGSSM